MFSGISTNLQFVVPTTAATTEAAELITQVRFTNSKSFEVDSFNNISALVQLRRNINKASVTSQSEYSLLPGLTFTNTALSEKYKLRLDWEGYLSQNEGKSLNNITTVNGADRLVAGVDMSGIMGINSIFPYVEHVTSEVKGTEKLGIGAQIYKSF
mgnify:CR=1 FL=1